VTLCRRRLNVWRYDPLDDAMATINPPRLAPLLSWLRRQAQRSIRPGRHKAGAAFQRGVAASIEKTAVGLGEGRLRGLTNPLPKI
jgi:hypothetical protein